jgi:hypothetical protein
MKRALITTVGCALLAGCGGTAHNSTISTAPKSTVTTPNVNKQLEAAVRRAVEQDHRLSVEALWTNQLPAKPPASGGPDLSILRRSVAQRRSAGVRVRVLSERFRILSVQLNPSYAAATATVLDEERVQPTTSNGKPRGKPSSTVEHVRLELRRVAGAERFLVWKVTLL